MYPPDQVETTREVFLKELKPKGIECRAHMFKDAVHGFSTRAYVCILAGRCLAGLQVLGSDLNNEKEKGQKDEAARLTIDWFKEYLK